MLSVSSLFNWQVQYHFPSSPALFFSLGTSNWSNHVLDYGTITRRSDKLSAGGMTVALANHLQEFNNLIDSNFFYDVDRRGTVKIGFSDGSSIDTLELYTGNLVGVSYKEAECEMEFLDQWETFVKTKIVSDVYSMFYLHDVNSFENNPADIFVTLVSCYAGLDFGTYVNCAAWEAWRNECGSYQYTIMAYSKGEKTIQDFLQEIVDLTNTTFSTEQGKIYPSIMTIITSYATYDESKIFKYELGITTDKLVNKFKIFWDNGIYGSATRKLTEIDSESYNAYGGHYKQIKNDTVYFSHASDKNWGIQKSLADTLARYGRPLKKMEITVPMIGMKNQINDRVRVSIAVVSLDNVKFRVEGIKIDPDNPTKTELNLIEDRFAKYWTTFNNFSDSGIDGQCAWLDMADATTVNGTVQTAVIFSGKEIEINPTSTKDCYISRFLPATPGDTPQWIKLKICSVDNTENYPIVRIFDPSVNSNLIYYRDDGEIDVRDGGSYVSTGVSYDTTNGETIKIKINFDTKTWDIYINDMDTPVLTDIDLMDSAQNDITRFEVIQYRNLAHAYMDDLFIGCYDPDSGI